MSLGVYVRPEAEADIEEIAGIGDNEHDERLPPSRFRTF